MRKSPLSLNSMLSLFALALMLSGGSESVFAASYSGKTPQFTPVSTTSLTEADAENDIQVPGLLPLEENDLSDSALDTAKNSNESETERLIREGNQSLAEKDWVHAKALFEKCLKTDPENTELRRNYRMARAHIEVDTRYHDATFCHFLAQTNKEEISRLCDDVLNDIQSWHVDAPDWNELYLLGMESFKIALTEEAFLRQNRVPEQFYEKLPTYGEKIYQAIQNRPVHNRGELKTQLFKMASGIQKTTQISGISVIMEVLCGMVNSLDSYSAYLTSGQISDLYSMIDGHFVGLGVYIEAEWKDGALNISKVIPNSPAQKAGLVDGDQILAIDGRDVKESETPEDAGSYLQGPEGSRVTLKIRSEGRSLREVTVLRRSFDIPSVENFQILQSEEENRKVASFKISAFQKTTVDEVKEILPRLENEGVECLVIDLRNNPGGLLDKAVELSNLFLDSGTIVKTRGRMSERIETADNQGTCRIPLILLIDENSASAAEIFAGAIQENNRGLVIGSRSFGKGTVQVIIQLASERTEEPIAGLRLTTEKFYSPLGRSYSGVGVIPDIDITGEYSVARPNALTAISLDQADSVPAAEEPALQGDICLARALSEADRVIRRQQREAGQLSQMDRRNPQ